MNTGPSNFDIQTIPFQPQWHGWSRALGIALGSSGAIHVVVLVALAIMRLQPDLPGQSDPRGGMTIVAVGDHPSTLPGQHESRQPQAAFVARLPTHEVPDALSPRQAQRQTPQPRTLESARNEVAKHSNANKIEQSPVHIAATPSRSSASRRAHVADEPLRPLSPDRDRLVERSMRAEWAPAGRSTQVPAAAVSPRHAQRNSPRPQPLEFSRTEVVEQRRAKKVQRYPDRFVATPTLAAAPRRPHDAEEPLRPLSPHRERTAPRIMPGKWAPPSIPTANVPRRPIDRLAAKKPLRAAATDIARRDQTAQPPTRPVEVEFANAASAPSAALSERQSLAAATFPPLSPREVPARQTEPQELQTDANVVTIPARDGLGQLEFGNSGSASGRSQGHYLRHVVLQVRVNRRGTVVRSRVLQSSGLWTLDRAALQAVENWRFPPARLLRETVGLTVTIPVPLDSLAAD